MRYPIGSSSQVLVFTDPVLAHFWGKRQRRPWSCEAGGQLFGRYDGNVIEIVEATGPRARDTRTPWSYMPDRADEQLEIDMRHTAGLIFLGDWHTHAQQQPYPSEQDRRNIADIVQKSEHSMNGLLLVIVGTSLPPTGLCVCVSDGDELHVLSPVDDG